MRLITLMERHNSNNRMRRYLRRLWSSFNLFRDARVIELRTGFNMNLILMSRLR
jgi:hypothetical protein